MSIIWKYLDKRSAAVDALKDYGSMKFIIGHTDDEIKSAYDVLKERYRQRWNTWRGSSQPGKN